MAAFSFDLGFQRALLRLMQKDELFCLRCVQHVRASFFTIEPLGWLFGLSVNYWKVYHLPPSDVVLRTEVRRVSADRVQFYMQEVEAVIAQGEVGEHEFVKAQLADFCRRNAFAIAHEESARLFNASQPDKAYDVMAAAQEQMQQIDFGSVDRQWFFEEFDERQRARIARQQRDRRFFTGIAELDRVTGGVQPGDVWAMLAYAKIGKTTWLVNQGYNAVRVTKERVLHICLEGKKHEVPDRYDTLFSNCLYSRVKVGDIDLPTFRALEEEYSYNRGLLVTRFIDDWSTTALDIERELKELRAHNFVPGMLILDYVDLLRARSRVESELQHQVEASRDLKRIATRHDLAVWTAWQAQRPRENAGLTPHILTSSNVADAYAKVRIVDAYGSINITDAERARGEMRVHIEASRGADIHKTWIVTNDLSRSRMVLDVVAAAPGPAAAPKAE